MTGSTPYWRSRRGGVPQSHKELLELDRHPKRRIGLNKTKGSEMKKSKLQQTASIVMTLVLISVTSAFAQDFEFEAGYPTPEASQLRGVHGY